MLVVSIVCEATALVPHGTGKEPPVFKVDTARALSKLTALTQFVESSVHDQTRGVVVDFGGREQSRLFQACLTRSSLISVAVPRSSFLISETKTHWCAG